jgi:hypothetical protein
VAGTYECGNKPTDSIKCGNILTSCKPVSFSRRTLLHGVSKWKIFVLEDSIVLTSCTVSLGTFRR